MRKIAAFAALGSIGLLATPIAARAASMVTVKLEDPSDPGVKHMAIVAKPDDVKPGKITFDVKNDSKFLVHQMLVVKPPPSGKLPYSTKNDAIIQTKIDMLENSGGLKPGVSKTTHATLKPGKYLLLCNEPGHYKAGMWTWFYVKK